MARKKRMHEHLEFEKMDIKGQALTPEPEEGKRFKTDSRHVLPGEAGVFQEMRRKGGITEVKLVSRTTSSPRRTEPWCEHFLTCGGCSWQHAEYSAQLEFKDQMLADVLAGVPDIGQPQGPIIPSPLERNYRNKLEFSFSQRRWFEGAGTTTDSRALGFFVPRQNNRVVDIKTCYHMGEETNRIRNRVREIALQEDITFHDPIAHEGLLRTLLIRVTGTGEIMVALVVNSYEEKEIRVILDSVQREFPSVRSIYYIINSKMNDAYGDCPAFHYSGETAVYEKIADLRFRVGPLSFFQVNPRQTENLYALIAEYANLDGSQRVYDLYTGTGSIALSLAKNAKSIIGIEYVEAAVEDARINASLNGITNCEFHAGDMKDVFTKEFLARHQRPDIIVCDPPRAGMHPDVISSILGSDVASIVYVSCNPASLARDLMALSENYRVVTYRAVDMSPQTPHIETVVLLEKLSM